MTALDAVVSSMGAASKNNMEDIEQGISSRRNAKTRAGKTFRVSWMRQSAMKVLKVHIAGWQQLLQASALHQNDFKKISGRPHFGMPLSMLLERS